MKINFNANIKLLMGGSYCGGEYWNKSANELDRCFKIYHMREGEAQISTENATFTLRAGHLYFINGYVLKEQRCLKKFVVDWIHFHPESVYFEYILKFAPCLIELKQEDFESYSALFPKIKYYFLDRLEEINQRVVMLETQSLVLFVIAKILEKHEAHIHFEDQDFMRLLPSLDLMLAKFNTPLSLLEIAASCCLSPNYFHRLFIKTFQITPFAHLQKIRMEEAVRQLAYTNKSVKEIAFSVGYDDEAYFSRAFSKYYKTSPGRYRASYTKRLP